MLINLFNFSHEIIIHGMNSRRITTIFNFKITQHLSQVTFPATWKWYSISSKVSNISKVANDKQITNLSSYKMGEHKYPENRYTFHISQNENIINCLL